MALVRYEPDYRGTGELLVTPEMHHLVERAAEAGKDYAIAISPDAPPLGEGYIASFRVEAGLVDQVAGEDRATARLWNDADHAARVEWENGDHILGRTVDYLENAWFPRG